MIRKLVAGLVFALVCLCVVLLAYKTVLRQFSAITAAPPSPSAVKSVPTLSPTPTVVPIGLRGGIAFGTSVFRNDRGFYIPTVRTRFRFPSSISWIAYLSKPVRRALLLLEIVRFRPGARVISRQVFRIGDDAVRVMPYVISPDEWRKYGFTGQGVYGVRYSAGSLEVAEGIFRLT